MVLLTIETVKIKDYLFSTNKLKVIRGASYLLDYLNQVLVVDILKKHGLVQEHEDYLYVAAGNAKVLVDTEKKAQEIIKEVEEAYSRIAPGAKIATSTVENKENKKIWDLIKDSTDKTAQVKNKGFKELNYHLPFVKKCDLCTTNPAEIDKNNLDSFIETYLDNFNIAKEDKNKHGKFNSIFNNLNSQEESHICKECLSKLIVSEMVKPDNKEIGFYSKFRENFEKEFNDFKMAKTIEDYKDNKSFIGFMYADGDGLGDFLSKLNEKFLNIKDDKEANKAYREFLKEFSLRLDEVTKDSLVEAMKELRDKFPKIKNSDKRYYGEFLIVGGDDVCGVFPADLVLELSEKYQAIFEREMYKYFEDSSKKYFGEVPKEKTNITTSSGVLIAKAKTPMYLLFNQSLKLQKLAKKARYNKFKDKKEEKKHGYTDFQVIGSEGNVDIMDFRAVQKLENLMERPYEVSDNDNNLKKLIEKIQNFKKSDFPRNKIRKFYDLKKEMNKTEALYEFVNLYSKLTKEQQDLLKIEFDEDITLDKNLSNIFDILEMYGFVQDEGVKNEN